MHIRFDGKPVTSGDHNSVAVMFNNLSGASFVNKGPWPGYIAMMNAEFFAENPLTAGMRVDLVSLDDATPFVRVLRQYGNLRRVA